MTSFPSTVKVISARRVELEANDLRPESMYCKHLLQCLVIVREDEPGDVEVGRTAPSIPADAGFDAVDTNRNIVPRILLQYV